MAIERRIFSRVKFDAKIYLELSGHRQQAQLIDISLKGALVTFEGESIIQKGEECLFELHLNETDLILKLNAVLMFHKDNQYGLKFGEIVLDNMIHLRRLLELNVGDPDKIRDELFFLSST